MILSLLTIRIIFYKLNHDLIFRYLGVLVFLSFFIYKEEYFKSRKIVGNLFVMMGQRSLDIYLIHYFLLPVVLILPSWLNSNQMWYLQLLILAVLSFLVIGGCLLISNVIRMSSFLSQILLGVRKQN